MWTDDDRIDLMESFLTGCPVGSIILNDRMNARWGYKISYAVIDGRQRLETICAWFDGKLFIPASWVQALISPDAEPRQTGDGPYVCVNDLTELGQAKVESRMSIQQYVTNVPTLSAEARVYRLVNKGGQAHTTADLDHAAQVENS